MKIAFIVPRFEPQLAGGAEVHCQKLAERIATRGYQVELLTTCARDHFSWKNYYEPGNNIVNGIMVRRFLADPNRVTSRFLTIQRKIDHKIKLTNKEEMWWISDSVRSQDMERFIIKNRDSYNWFIFMPYLFGTTYWGIQAVPEKSLLIPCLHDEPFARLGIFKEMFNRVQGIMFNTYPEIELAKGLYSIKDENLTLVSLGFDTEGLYDPNLLRERYGIYPPFLLFAGRREGGKNINLLLDYFRAYRKNNDSNLKLLLLGSGVVDLTTEDKAFIIDLRYIPEDAKRSAFGSSLAFCQPSVNESLSIVVMESWLAKRPVLVNAGCKVTVDHCKRSNGGLYFSDYLEFEECVNLLLNNPQVSDQMGKNGREYVEENFSWDAVLDRFEDSLKKFNESRSISGGICNR